MSARFAKLSRKDIPGEGQIIQALAKTLEFRNGRKTGAHNPFMQMANTEHELQIAFEVWEQFRAGHTKADSAYQRVVEMHPTTCDHSKKCQQISRSTVRSCWKKHGNIFKKVSN